jgi:NAD(P)-dependent dehydrogenase (short-subunit alcohol dehydrogenase family)
MSGTRPLSGKIAVVAGATRGAGRGIARMLGEAGAFVYCTGRSVKGAPATPGRPETIDETVEMIREARGEAAAVRVDHRRPGDIQTLFAQVREKHGCLDILVNDIWGGDELMEWKPFWKLDTDKGFRMLDTAIRTHILTSRHGAPLMVEKGTGLIVEITDGEFTGYRGSLFYDLAKIGAIRLAHDMANDLKDTNVTALAVTPGFLRSEAMLERFGVTEANWIDAAKKVRGFEESETPCFVGRAVAALAADPNVRAKAGKVFASWTLAKEYGFADIDGRKPDWGACVERCVTKILDHAGTPHGEDRHWLEMALLLWQDDSKHQALVARMTAALKGT